MITTTISLGDVQCACLRFKPTTYDNILCLVPLGQLKLLHVWQFAMKVLADYQYNLFFTIRKKTKKKSLLIKKKSKSYFHPPLTRFWSGFTLCFWTPRSMKQAPQFILKNQNLNVKCVTVISVNLKTNKKKLRFKRKLKPRTYFI